MKCRFILLTTITLSLSYSPVCGSSSAAILYESGTLGPTGVSWHDLESQTVPGTNISTFAYNGVRFQLNRPCLPAESGATSWHRQAAHSLVPLLN